MADHKVCSACGGPIKCEYVGDTGSVDHYYTFRHTCILCEHEETFDAFSCGGQETIEDVKRYERGEAPCCCPGCGEMPPPKK
jgi:hypothetical protein